MFNIRTSWKRTKDTLCECAEWIVAVIGCLIIGYLTILVWLYFFNDENSIPMKTNILIQLLFCALIIGAIKLAGNALNKNARAGRVISLLFFALTVSAVGAICFSYVSQTLLLPISDGKSCFDIAVRFANSEFGAVVPQGSYLSVWPYQTGFIFILEKLMRIFNTQEPLFFQQINCFYVLLIISAGYFVVYLLSKKIEAQLIYMALMLNYWTLFFDVGVVYGDLPGLAWTMVSIACYFCFFRVSRKWQKSLSLIGFLCSTLLACVYKGNCLIYIVAVLLITFVLQLKKMRPALLITVAVTALLSIFATDITQKYYESYAGNVCGRGMPATGWIAMGLQYNGKEAIPGGWNGYHTDVFLSNDYNYEVSDAIFRESIKESLKEFADDPAFACDFFYNKTLKQWANQTHGVWWENGSYYDLSRDEGSFWVRFCENKKYCGMLKYIDVHESIVYSILALSAFSILSQKCRKQKIEMWKLLPFVTFIGGFLFSLFWEGQTDTVMSYPIILLPTASAIWAETELAIKDRRSE